MNNINTELMLIQALELDLYVTTLYRHLLFTKTKMKLYMDLKFKISCHKR